METNTKFQQNAVVVASGGEEIGRLSRVVMRPESKEVTHIVVTMKALLNPDERIIPIESIASTNDSQVILKWSADEVQSSPLFEEEHLISAGGASTPVTPLPTQTPNFDSSIRNIPPFMTPPPDISITDNAQNIREGSVAVKEGAKVFSHEGKAIGNLERIVANLPGDQATHLLVSMGLAGGVKRLIPVTWVKSMSEEEIHLRVKEETVDEVGTPPDESED